MKYKGEKMPVYEGADGRLYFNFAVGLKMAMHGNDRDKNENYEYEIYDCRYVGNTEYYDIRIDGIPMPAPDSANRVKYLVSRYGIKTLAVGKRRELPLTVEEVKRYYQIKEYRTAAAQQKANTLSEYTELKSEVAALAIDIAYAEAAEKLERAEYLSAKRDKLWRQANEVLKSNGINPEDLKEPERCKLCGGKRYLSNTVCSCALHSKKEIKDYCAAERLRLRALMQ